MKVGFNMAVFRSYTSRLMMAFSLICSRALLSLHRSSGWLFVQLFTDADLVGSGEASQTGDDDAVERLLLHSLAPRLLGKDPRDAAVLWQEMVGDQRGCRMIGMATAAAISAIDQALWDLRGQALACRCTSSSAAS